MTDFSSLPPIGPGVNGAAHATPAHRVDAASRLADANRMNGAAVPAEHGAQADRVELSQFARYMDQLRQLPEVRHDRVERVRESIQRETYETEEKLDAAITQWAREEL